MVKLKLIYFVPKKIFTFDFSKENLFRLIGQHLQLYNGMHGKRKNLQILSLCNISLQVLFAFLGKI